jgi:O-antigen/teichoic acid export membrane protein
MAWSRAVRALLPTGSGRAAVAQTGIATVLVLLVNVATGVVSARVLGAQGRGALSALLLCPQFLSFLFALGLPTSSIVKIKNAPGSAAGLMGAALMVSLLMGLLAAATGALVLPYLMKQYSPHLVTVAQLLLVFVMLGVSSTVLVAALQLRDRFTAYNRVRFWQSLLTLLSLTTLAVMHAFTPVTGALAYLLPTLPFFAWNLWWVLREFRPNLSSWRTHCATLLSFGGRVQLVDIGNTLFTQIDKLILVAVLAPALFGIYVVVFNLSRLVTTFAAAATPVLLPRAAGRSVGEVMTLTSRALIATAWLSAAGVLGFVLFGSIGLRLVYGEQFVAGYAVLIVLTIEGALASSALVLQQPYMVLNRPGVVASFHAVALALAALLVYVLGRRFGPEGAACGMLIGTSVRFLLTYLGFTRLLRVRAPRLWPTRAQVFALLDRVRTSVA